MLKDNHIILNCIICVLDMHMRYPCHKIMRYIHLLRIIDLTPMNKGGDQIHMRLLEFSMLIYTLKHVFQAAYIRKISFYA